MEERNMDIKKLLIGTFLLTPLTGSAYLLVEDDEGKLVPGKEQVVRKNGYGQMNGRTLYLGGKIHDTQYTPIVSANITNIREADKLGRRIFRQVVLAENCKEKTEIIEVKKTTEKFVVITTYYLVDHNVAHLIHELLFSRNCDTGAFKALLPNGQKHYDDHLAFVSKWLFLEEAIWSGKKYLNDKSEHIMLLASSHLGGDAGEDTEQIKTVMEFCGKIINFLQSEGVRAGIIFGDGPDVEKKVWKNFEPAKMPRNIDRREIFE